MVSGWVLLKDSAVPDSCDTAAGFQAHGTYVSCFEAAGCRFGFTCWLASFPSPRAGVLNASGSTTEVWLLGQQQSAALGTRCTYRTTCINNDS